MEAKTSELIGPALDWAVAKAEGYDEWEWDRDVSNLWLIRRSTQTEHWLRGYYEPSTDWSQGGPIIEREKISSEHKFFPEGWECRNGRNAFARGPTALIAAMRCFVSSRLGEEVEVPDELA